MKTFAVSLCLTLLLPWQTFAQNSNGSPTRAAEPTCEGLARACSAAADEIAAARKLIAGYKANVAASDERIRIAERQIETWKEKSALEGLKARELESVIAAERDVRAELLKKIEIQKRRINSLEKQLGRVRKVALITTVAAAVGIVIAVGK